MFCSNCGSELPQNALFCANCGTRASGQAQEVTEVTEAQEANTEAVEVAEAVQEAPTAEPVVEAEPVVAPVYTAPYVPNTTPELPKSEFDGGFWGLFGVNFLLGFVSVISLGFAFPAMYCFRLRWFYKHTVINGKRLAFNGKGRQLFGRYILWCFLSVITCGIFAL